MINNIDIRDEILKEAITDIESINHTKKVHVVSVERGGLIKGEIEIEGWR